MILRNHIPNSITAKFPFGTHQKLGPVRFVLISCGVLLGSMIGIAGGQENGTVNANAASGNQTPAARISRLPSLADQIPVPAKQTPETATPQIQTGGAQQLPMVGNPHLGGIQFQPLPDDPAIATQGGPEVFQNPLYNPNLPATPVSANRNPGSNIAPGDDNQWRPITPRPNTELQLPIDQIQKSTGLGVSESDSGPSLGEMQPMSLPPIPSFEPNGLDNFQSGDQQSSQFTAGPSTQPDYSSPLIEAQSTTEPWWRSKVAESVTGQPSGQPIDVCTLIQEGMQSSKQIQALSQNPLIRESEIGIALAQFDPGMFAKTLYDDRVDPVGNTLTTGGLPFLKDNIWSGEAGFRQKLYTGGNLKISQSLGFQNSNSRFFVPQDQGTATLSINYEQPLLRGRGEFVNRSQIFLAEVAAGAASDEFAARLQDELNQIVTAYWTLYGNRAQLLQRKKNYELGRQVLERLEGRANFDTLPLQLAQARAAVANRETALANAHRDVLIAETEIRRLLSAADWTGWQNVELLTVEPPMRDPSQATLEASVHTALENRPELRQATRRTKAAAIRNQVSANDLLPDLKLLFGTYVAALEPESGVLPAWSKQFNGSTPGFSAGFQYDFPWRNRAARSKMKQSELELTKAQLELEQVTVNLIVDAQQSWYRLESARKRLDSSLMAMSAATAELEQNELRWNNAAMIEGDWSDGQTQSLILDQLLASHQKQFDAERVVVESEQELKLAQVNLKRATGTLLGFCQGVPTQISNQPTIEESETSGQYPLAPEIAPGSQPPMR